MPFRPLVLSLIAALVLSAGLALSAHATGQLIERGTEGIAASLVSVAPPSPDPGVVAEKPSEKSKASTKAKQAKPARAVAERAAKQVQRQKSEAKAVRKVSITSATSKTPKTPKSLVVGARPALSWQSERLLTPRADAPVCDDVYLYIVTAFERPADSVATLSLDAKKRGRQRKVGQHVGPYEVIAIGYNRSRVSSAVWLAKGDRVCQALVQDANPVRERAHKKQAKLERQKAKARKAKARKAKARKAKARKKARKARARKAKARKKARKARARKARARKARARKARARKK